MRIENRMRDMDEDFTNRVEKLEYQVKENRNKMMLVQDEIKDMRKDLHDSIERQDERYLAIANLMQKLLN